MNTFKIYIPINKTYYTNNRVVYTIFFASFIPGLFESIILRREHLSLFSIVSIIFGLSIYLMFSLVFGIYGHIKSKPLKGIIDGAITFENDNIKIQNDDFYIKDIKRINFPCFNDYRGMVEKYVKHNLNGRESNGVDNMVEIYLQNDKKVVCNFQLTHRYQIRDIREQLTSYYNSGKLSFENLIEMLGIEDYNAIQNFKNTLSIKSY